MKLIKTDFRKGIVTLQAEDMDDLWHLSVLIRVGDHVRSRTLRKIKKGTEEDRKTTIIKKPVTLTLAVEKIDYQTTTLRIGGSISEGPDDIPKGSHHGITLEVGDTLTLIKDHWLGFERQRLEESAQAKTPVLICLLDREEALIAITKPYGFETLAHLHGDVQKKREGVIAKGGFYKEVAAALGNYRDRLDLTTIIVASPAFYKEDFLKVVPGELKKMIISATCHAVEPNAIKEVLSRPETASALAQNRLANETKLIDDLLHALGSGSKAVYGETQVRDAALSGAVNSLLITDQFITEKRENAQARDIEELMKLVESAKGEVHIISTTHEAGKKLQGLGGIAALTRYELH